MPVDVAQHRHGRVVVPVVQGEVVGQQRGCGDHVVAEEQHQGPVAGRRPEVAGPSRAAVWLDQDPVGCEVGGDVEVLAVDHHHDLGAGQRLGPQAGQCAPQDVPPLAGRDDDHEVVRAGPAGHAVPGSRGRPARWRGGVSASGSPSAGP